MHKSNSGISRPIPLSRRARNQLLRTALMEVLEPRLLLSGNVVLFHADPLSTGAYTNETVLTPANVNSTDFGRQFITALDGQVYAQPLAVANVNVTVGASPGIHNVLYVATMHDSLFAVDADTGVILWQDSFLQLDNPQVATILSPVPTAGVHSFPSTGTNSPSQDNFAASPEIGIYGTPYIDTASGVLYCFTSTQEWRSDSATGSGPTILTSLNGTTNNAHFVFRIWAVNLSDGSVAVTPAAPTTGAPVPSAAGATIADTVLNPLTQNGTLTYSNFGTFYGYQYVAGPYIKASGDNTSTYVTHPNNVDGWVTNPNDTSSAFAGTYPTAQSDIALNAIVEGMRVGMTMLNGVLYAGFTSHGDKGPYYGWVVGINASTLQTQSAFVTTPSYTDWNTVSGNSGFHNGSTIYDAQGSIWGGEQGIITDGTYLYMAVGNGDFNWTPGNFSTGYYATEVGGTHVLLPIDGNYGNSYVKLTVDSSANQSSLDLNSWPTTYNPHGQNPNGYGLSVIDYFTPSDLLIRNYYDWDVGSSGIVMFPNSVTSTVPGHEGHPMMAAGSKEGKLYLMDRNDMGGFASTSSSKPYFVMNGTQLQYDGGAAIFNVSNVPQVGPDARLYDRVLGEYQYSGLNYATDGIGGKQKTLSSPTFLMNGTTATYYNDADGNGILSFDLAAFQYTTTTPISSLAPNPTPLAAATSPVIPNNGNTTVASSNGTSNGIVWIIRPNNTTTSGTVANIDNLLAYSANGTSAIYDSNTNVATDALTGRGTVSLLSSAKATKFSQPIVFNGMVYAGLGAGWGSASIPAQGGIVGYGLLSSYLNATASYFGAPTSLSGIHAGLAGTTLSWTRNSTLETHSRIERSSDGTNWAVIGYTDNGANSYTDSSAQATSAYYYRVSAINGAQVTALSNTAQIAALPAWLGSNSVGTWAANSSTVTASGAVSIVADPVVAPIINAVGTSPVQVTITPSANNIVVHLGSLNGIASFTQNSTGTATLSGASNYTGSTTITAGRLDFGGGVTHSIAGVSGTGSLSVAASTVLTSDGVNLPAGSLIVAGTQTIRSSAAAAYAAYATGSSATLLSGTSKVSVLSITGSLDIKNNALIIQTADTTSKAALLAAIANTASGMLVTGAITSSSAASNVNYTLSVLDNGLLGASTFGGLPVTPTSVIVTETLKGDATMDGSVDLLDLARWKANAGHTNVYSPVGGDMNGDGGVDLLDLAMWKANAGHNITTSPAPSDFSSGGLGTLSAPVIGSGGLSGGVSMSTVKSATTVNPSANPVIQTTILASATQGGVSTKSLTVQPTESVYLVHAKVSPIGSANRGNRLAVSSSRYRGLPGTGKHQIQLDQELLT